MGGGGGSSIWVVHDSEDTVRRALTIQHGHGRVIVTGVVHGDRNAGAAVPTAPLVPTLGVSPAGSSPHPGATVKRGASPSTRARIESVAAGGRLVRVSWREPLAGSTAPAGRQPWPPLLSSSTKVQEGTPNASWYGCNSTTTCVASVRRMLGRRGGGRLSRLCRAYLAHLDNPGSSPHTAASAACKVVVGPRVLCSRLAMESECAMPRLCMMEKT
jgi:hypothetical protein